MKYAAFIQSNKKQIIGAKLAKYALETRGGLKARGIPITIMEVETYPVFKAFEGKPYRKGYAPFSLSGDLQSFTMTRFMPPELMNYEGRALVIDPDIFALSNITALVDIELGNSAIAACTKKDAWDTSVMVLECAKLSHWKIADMLNDIATGAKSYEDFAQLRKEKTEIKEIPRIWNSLDDLNSETKMLHTTGRLTQPWKTGLPIDFIINPMPKYFSLIPREPIHKLLGKYPTHYKPHPDKNIEKFFFDLVKDAVSAGAVSKAEIVESINAGNIRKDALSLAGL